MPATTHQIAELLGDRGEELTIERIAEVGASFDEVQEALDDLEYERSFGVKRIPSTTRIAEVRVILGELPEFDSSLDQPGAESPLGR
jgi:hypothetical protein